MSPHGTPFEQRSWWPAVVGVTAAWIAMIHVGLWWIDRNPVPRTLWGDETTYLRSALQLLSGDPSWWPEPLWPPLYPQFLAGLTWLGGGSLATVAVVQGALLVLVAVLLFDLTRCWTGSRAAGAVAAAVTLGYPPLVAFTHYLWPEILHLFLFVALLWMLAMRADRFLWCAVGGVVLGLALLCKSLLLPFVPVLLLATVWGRTPWRSLGIMVTVLGMAAATVAPVVFANARRTGTPGIANSATFNLWVGLNDVGRESFRHDIVWPEYQQWVASARDHAARDRILRSRIRALVRERGLLVVLQNQLRKQYFRLFDASCYLSDQLPGGAAQVTARAGYLGFPSDRAATAARLITASIVALYLATVAGLVLGPCARQRWIRTLLLFIGYNLLLFLWLHVKTRYRIQMLPAAFVGVGCLAAWLEAGCRPGPSILRWIFAVAVAAVITWLALA